MRLGLPRALLGSLCSVAHHGKFRRRRRARGTARRFSGQCCSQEWAHSRLLARGHETGCSIKAIPIGHGDCWHPEMRSPCREILRREGAIFHREVRTDVEVDERPHVTRRTVQTCRGGAIGSRGKTSCCATTTRSGGCPRTTNGTCSRCSSWKARRQDCPGPRS